MKKVIVLLIILTLLTSMFYTVAKPPQNHGRDKPNNTNKAKGKNKDDTIEEKTTIFISKYFGGQITITELVTCHWGYWSNYWKITQNTIEG